MDIFLDIVKYTIPALIVFATTWYIVRTFFLNYDRQKNKELLMKSHEIIIPLRFQAYERIILFLERISIDSMLMRLNKQGMNCRNLHTELLTSIRNEFEHNQSQQLYMSIEAWEMVKRARAQTLKIINSAAEKTDPKLPAIELNKKIIENIGEYSKTPTQEAIDFIKKEVQELF
jgi:hypothetical protein